MPEVSVIVPNYNHKKYLRKRLDSIFNQTFINCEVILLDDKSTDGSIDILQEYSKRPQVSHFIINSKNSGCPFKQWQKGIELAKGKYIWIAESDDWADPTFLERTLSVFKINENLGLVYSQSYIATHNDALRGHYDYKVIGFSNDERWTKNNFNRGKTEIRDFLTRRNTIPNASAVLIKSKALPQDLTFLNQFKLLGDWFLWIKILEKSDIYYLSEYLNFFRTSENNTREHDTKEKKVLRKFEELLVKKHLYKKRFISNNEFQRFFTTYVKSAKKLLGGRQYLLFFSKKIKFLSWRENYTLIKFFLKGTVK